MAERAMTAFWAPEGPRIELYEENKRIFFQVEDLNPEVTIAWAVSRGDLFRLGLNLIRAAIFPPKAG